MSIRITQIAFGAATLAASLGFASFAPAQAQTAIQQCSSKYQEAKTNNTLNGMKWPQFSSKCQAELKAQPAAATSPAPAATPAAAPTNPLKPAPAPTTAAAPKPAAPAAAAKPASPAVAAAGGAITYPAAVDPKYATFKPEQARMKTCGDAWQANKAANTTGGMKWNQKGGGGYMSLCNNKLKGI